MLILRRLDHVTPPAYSSKEKFSSVDHQIFIYILPRMMPIHANLKINDRQSLEASLRVRD